MNTTHFKTALRNTLRRVHWASFLPAMAIALIAVAVPLALTPPERQGWLQHALLLGVALTGSVVVALAMLAKGLAPAPAAKRPVLTLELSADDLNDPLRRSLLWGVIENADREGLDLHFKVPGEEDVPTLMGGLQDLLDEHDAETTLHKRVNLYSAPDTA